MPRDQVGGGAYDDFARYFFFAGRFAAMPKFFVQLPGKPATGEARPGGPARKKLYFFLGRAREDRNLQGFIRVSGKPCSRHGPDLAQPE